MDTQDAIKHTTPFGREWTDTDPVPKAQSKEGISRGKPSPTNAEGLLQTRNLITQWDSSHQCSRPDLLGKNVLSKIFLLSHGIKKTSTRLLTKQTKRAHLLAHTKATVSGWEILHAESTSPTGKSLAFLIHSYRTMLRICALVDKAIGIYQASTRISTRITKRVTRF